MYSKLLTKQFSEVDLDNYVEILLIISDQEHPLTQTQLAGLFQIDKSRMVSILFSLSQKEFIQVVRNPADRREHFVYLSAKAEEMIPTIKDILYQTTILARNGITQEKLNCCFDVLETMQKNLLTVLAESA